MWPLLFCSVLGLAVILDRLLVFLWIGRASPVFREIEKRLSKEARADSLEQLGAFLSKSRHPVAGVARVYIENLHRPPSLRMELVKTKGAAELERVEKRLRILATISHLSPLLGLLGTVTGLVIAFAAMQSLGAAAKPSDLAGGIWEALLTTVFGLIIAIPCMAAYHAFEGAADKISRRMQNAVVVLDDLFESAAARETPSPVEFRHIDAEADFNTVG